MATYDEAYQASLEYYKGDDLAAKTFVDKYALRDNENDFKELTPDDMHHRLAKELARIEAKYPNPLSEDEIYLALKDFKYIVPQGSPMSAIGNPYQLQSLSNCVVVPSPEDTMESIIDAGKAIAQLSKRRCVEADTRVMTERRGAVCIKDVSIGDNVLSFDKYSGSLVFRRVLNKFETWVNPEDRIIIEASTGAQLKTSRKHPVLTWDNGEYSYTNAGAIGVGSVLITPSSELIPTPPIPGSDLADVGWYIGAHIGDGSSDRISGRCSKDYPGGRKVYYYPKIRIRMLGDNENIVAEYSRIHNRLTESSVKYNISSNKQYKTVCWEYVSVCKKNADIIDRLFDGLVGSKTYTAKTPSYVKDNCLWAPYIAGLIDTDGYVRNEGACVILTLCAKDVIDDVAAYLNAAGISTKTTIIQPYPGRENESISYRISIHSSRDFIDLILPYMRHKAKAEKLRNGQNYREFSRKFPISDKELSMIFSRYEASKDKYNNLSSIITLLRKDGTGVGAGGLRELVVGCVLTEAEALAIKQRVYVSSVINDAISTKYFDIEVEETNNFFAGSYGLVNIHNCGIGLDLSNLRPEGASVNNAARTTSGAWSFADFYSYVGRMIGQGGRRAALMISLDVRHPDVAKFAVMKRDLSKVTGANVSIRINDEFMEAVRGNHSFRLQWPVDCENPKVVKEIKARELWEVIISSVTASAEPGLMMWDNITRELPADCYAKNSFKTITCNPCGELPLSAGDACRLLTLNLYSFVQNRFEKNAEFDFSLFTQKAKIAQRLMDDIVDLELEAIDKILKVVDQSSERDIWLRLRNSCVQGRRTGTGTFGLADALACCGLRYDSDAGIEITGKIFEALRDATYEQSVDLAEERGMFPVWDWDTEKDCPFIQRLPKNILERMKKVGRRNISLLTNAPTGSVAIVSHNSSSGIEPVFRNFYTRRKKVNHDDKNARVDFVDHLGDRWQEFNVFHRNVADWIRLHTPEWDGELVPELPKFFTTSDQIDWQKRVKIQSVIQQYIDHSISSTINLPEGTSEKTVGDLYLRGWELGLKGITIYVDGSRTGVLVSKSDKDKDGRPTKIVRTQAPRRPDVLEADVYHSVVEGEPWTVVVGLFDGEPYELFGGPAKEAGIPKSVKSGYMTKTKVNKDRNRYDLSFIYGGEEKIVSDIGNLFKNKTYSIFTRTISLALRHGSPIQHLVEQLSRDESEDLFSISSVFRRALKKYIGEGIQTAVKGKTCEKCGSSNLKMQDGCPTCLDCGSGKCM